MPNIRVEFTGSLGGPLAGLFDIPNGTPLEDKEAVELATLHWVSCFNHHRLLKPIGYIPPAEAEAT